MAVARSAIGLGFRRFHRLLSSHNLTNIAISDTCLSPSSSSSFLIRKSLPESSSPFRTSTNSGVRFLATSRRQPIRNSRGVDIGARARQLHNRRLWTYALTFSGVAGFIIIVLNNFQDQMVFYITPTDALEKFAANPSNNRFRLGGLVLEGSVVHPEDSPEMEFVITDLITDILVRYEGSLPDLFREGHSAVVEGFVKPFTEESKRTAVDQEEVVVGTENRSEGVSSKAKSGDCYFAATEVLAKHDEKYMPKEVAAAIERNKAAIEAANSNSTEKEKEG